MISRFGFVAATVLAGSTTHCLGQPTVTFGTGAGSSFMETPTWNTTHGGWMVLIRVVNPTANFEVDIEAGTSVHVSDLAIDFNDTNYDVDLYVHGAQRTDKCGNVRGKKRCLEPILTGT